MNKLRTTFIALLFCILSPAIFAQGPPPANMPTKENEKLITQIIQISDYESYFKRLCMRSIETEAREQKWSEVKKQEIITSINFEHFSSTIYNLYASKDSSELVQIITFLKEINKNKNTNKFVLTNSMVEGNLDLYIRSPLEGKYVMSNK